MQKVNTSQVVDMIQTTERLADLADNGFYITLYCNAKGNYVSCIKKQMGADAVWEDEFVSNTVNGAVLQAWCRCIEDWEDGTADKQPNRETILTCAVETYGVDAQTDMCIEEMSELTKAIMKRNRLLLADYHSEAEYDECVKNILEEVADVQIMLDQMRIMFGDTKRIEEWKLKRLKERLDGATKEGVNND